MDGFFGIGIQELILIAIVALIVLGPERLPATFREIAKFIRQARNLTRDFTQQFGDDFKALEDLDPRRMLQQAIESIDEEEQAKESAAKGKTTTGKPATPAKTTPAKPVTSNTGKVTTKSSTTASTTSTTKTTSSASKTVASSAKETAQTAPTTESAAATPQPAAAGAEIAGTPPNAEVAPLAVSENENRIAPPAVETSLQPTPESGGSSVVHAVSANGLSNEGHNATTGEAATTTPVTTNGSQEHSSNE